MYLRHLVRYCTPPILGLAARLEAYSRKGRQQHSTVRQIQRLPSDAHFWSALQEQLSER